jgi:ATP-dependent Zn protease
MLGPASPLHIIVFDEFDALVKQRGSSASGSSNI